jgi:hypothetical protein
MDVKKLRETVDSLFGKRSTLMTLWQDTGENFYPERADFTVKRDVGTEFASNLTTSYPALCRRDLGDQIGIMLRQTERPWFHMAPVDTGRENNESKRWLEYAETVQRRAMYDRVARLSRATKEGDHDFAAFGQCVISVRLNKNADALLYRCWHLRDVVWLENEDGEICLIARKWKPYCRDLARLFPGKCHPSVISEAEKNGLEEVDCYHIICEADMYDGQSKGRPYWSIYIDCKHDNHVMEEVPVFNKEYIIPRWQTVSGSQYAYSPATIVALPDARLIQAMTYTLLEAGEKLVNPPLIATQDAVRSDIAIYAGGVTWVDMDYDEKMGEALRPIPQDAKGMPLGIDMIQDARQMLSRAFFLNKLNLPQRTHQSTAYEIGQMVQEYIRGALPIFEPMEADYNGQLCDLTFDLLRRGGAFGSPYDMPKSLQGADIHFRFESPLHDAIEARKGQKFIEAKQLIDLAVGIDQSAAALLDFKTALRDALTGIQVPAEWVRDETTVQDIEDAQAAAKDSAEMLAAAESASLTAANLGKAQKDMSQVRGL